MVIKLILDNVLARHAARRARSAAFRKAKRSDPSKRTFKRRKQARIDGQWKKNREAKRAAHRAREHNQELELRQVDLAYRGHYKHTLKLSDDQMKERWHKDLLVPDDDYKILSDTGRPMRAAEVKRMRDRLEKKLAYIARQDERGEPVNISQDFDIINDMW